MVLTPDIDLSDDMAPTTIPKAGLPAQQAQAGAVAPGTTIEVQLCIAEDAERHLPRRRTAPAFLPPEAPVPRKGEVIFLSPTSPWAVSLVTHQWRSVNYLRVEVWLEPLGSIGRPAGFALTQ